MLTSNSPQKVWLRREFMLKSFNKKVNLDKYYLPKTTAKCRSELFYRLTERWNHIVKMSPLLNISHSLQETGHCFSWTPISVYHIQPFTNTSFVNADTHQLLIAAWHRSEGQDITQRHTQFLLMKRADCSLESPAPAGLLLGLRHIMSSSCWRTDRQSHLNRDFCLTQEEGEVAVSGQLRTKAGMNLGLLSMMITVHQRCAESFLKCSDDWNCFITSGGWTYFSVK